MRFVFAAMVNSDQTEGRGPMRTLALFDNEDAAVEVVRGKGVMGVGDGEVWRQRIFEDVDEYRDYIAQKRDTSTKFNVDKVWGYRNPPWKPGWDYGWIDFRDEPIKDPEYTEYLRLKAKFDS